VECRTPLATLLHLFLTPAKKCEQKNNWEPKKLEGQKKLGAKKKTLGNAGRDVAFPLKMSHLKT
jgi:hypothetical protein